LKVGDINNLFFNCFVVSFIWIQWFDINNSKPSPDLA